MYTDMLISQLFKETGVGQRKVKKAYEWIRSLIAKQEVKVIGAGGMFKPSQLVGEDSDHEKTEYLDLDITDDNDLAEIKTTLGEEFSVSGNSGRQLSELGMAIQKFADADESLSKTQLLNMMQEVYKVYEDSRKEKAERLKRGRIRKTLGGEKELM
jgi:hypothetical protein